MTIPNVRWTYVSISENPADCATRGISAESLRNFQLWWAGPPWLQDHFEWPQQQDLDQAVDPAVNASFVAALQSKTPDPE